MAHNSAQKLRGGYYSPKEISNFIVKWAVRDDWQPRNILEPSCGDGVFLESIEEQLGTKYVDCYAVELEEEEAEKARLKVGDSNVKVINDDFYNFYNNIKMFTDSKYTSFDLVVGNPPYIRYQYLTPEQREIQSQILVKNGMKSNKLINTWVSFVVACVEILNENGKIGLVLPAELLQVAYAEDLRLFLVDNLSKIAVVTFEELVFPDVQQEVVLLLGEKSDASNPDNKISIIELKNMDCLDDIDEFFSTIEFKEAIHNKNKWIKYFLSNEENKLIKSIQSDTRFVSFSQIADVNIGITTGNNNYFSVNKETVEKYKLHDAVRPLIGRSSHVNGLYFTNNDWLYNVEKEVAAHLIDFPDIPYEKYPREHKEYISLGESEEVHKGYKCSIRDRWYRVPSIWIPDAFFLRRNNMFPKFVLNDIDAVSTDTMHRIKFLNGIKREHVLISYYNSITFAFTELEGRSYGGGVLEILPGEVAKIMLPNVQELPEDDVKMLIRIVDDALRNKKAFEPVLDIVDRKILVEFLGIDYDDILKFRGIWKKLMNRRHQRK